MTEKKARSGAEDDLRKRAEERARASVSKPEEALLPEQAQSVLHDLRVHQIELEMQNEELRRVQEELEASRERYFDLYDLAPVGYFTLSEQGMILEANLAAARLIGVERRDLVAQPLTRFILSEDQDIFYKSRRQLFETGSPQVFDLRLKNQEGASLWARFEATAALSVDGSPISHAVMSDITERKQAEEVIRQAKETAESANQAKDQFISVLSHELRTPLTPVLAMVSSLQTQKDLPGHLGPDLELIQRNVEMEVALIEDLLDVTKISRGKVVLQYQTVDLQDCLRTALEICQGEIELKHLAIERDLQAAQHHVRADPARMRQVFWNLLNNAVKFTPEGGSITLHTHNEGERIIIDIIDTGVGIAPAVIPRIFNLFEQGDQSRTRRFGGLGLGLNIARAVVELHQGRLSAHSEGKNRGATFTVELATAPPPEKSQPQAASTEPPERPLRILLVEDHTDTLRVLVKILENWGHIVTAAASCKRALEVVASQEFDLLISDLGLPDGSGLDVMRQIKRGSETPGIALSGYGTDEDIRQSKAAGFAGHLVKPVNITALRTAIRQYAFADRP
ncbi:MAG: ATP-binding protein [Chthoniobacteraceae bacterium]